MSERSNADEMRVDFLNEVLRHSSDCTVSVFVNWNTLFFAVEFIVKKPNDLFTILFDYLLSLFRAVWQAPLPYPGG